MLLATWTRLIWTVPIGAPVIDVAIQLLDNRVSLVVESP